MTDRDPELGELEALVLRCLPRILEGSRRGYYAAADQIIAVGYGDPDRTVQLAVLLAKAAALVLIRAAPEVPPTLIAHDIGRHGEGLPEGDSRLATVRMIIAAIEGEPARVRTLAQAQYLQGVLPATMLLPELLHALRHLYQNGPTP